MRITSGGAALLASVGLVLGSAVAAAQNAPRKNAVNALSGLSASLQELSERASPAVVQVVTEGFGAAPGAVGLAGGAVTGERGSGSGVIIDPQGYIVTNAHVVERARRVEVLLAVPRSANDQWKSILKPRGTIVPAQIVGVDRETDLAVLKVEGKDFPALELGDSDQVQQGQVVLAFGSPLGLENSMTLGVVSSVARQLRPDAPMIHIQTDAPINPGNSGGPLVDTEGRVVGINTLILSQSGGSEGIGFAAPSNIVRYVVGQIQKDGRVRRGEIGISTQTVTPILAAGLGLAQDWGVVVVDVIPRGPADVAGVRIGDIVLRLEEKVMENARQLDVNLYQQPLGSIVKLEILRGGQKLPIRVAVLERPGDPDRLANLLARETQPIPQLGILAAKLDGRISQVLPPLRKFSGVVVTSVLAEPPAIGQHFLPGDVVYQVNQQPVTDVESLVAAISKPGKGDPVVVQVERGQRLMYIAFPMR